MKVLIIPSWYPNRKNNLVGSFFQEQASLLAANGYDVKILYGNIVNLSTLNYLQKKIMKLIFPKKTILQNDYLIQGPQAFSFPIYQFSDWWNEQDKNKEMCCSYVNAFSELLESGWKPDLIHAQCTVDAGIVSNHLSKLFKIPFVIIEHQIFLLNHYSKYKQTLIINALQCASKVGAVSNHQKRSILMNSIKCNPFVIWNLVDEDKFKIVPEKTNLKFRILTVTYPSFIKDMDTFFKSIEIFCQVFKDNIEVVVIGNNSFEDLDNANTFVFESLAKKYNVFSKCILIPSLPRIEIAKILNTADVFVSTSIAETFGVAVREAMLCGLPIIATKSGGVEDSINEKTGIRVNIGDFKAIAEALVKIKNQDIKFDANYIRNYVISQCGKTSFLNVMNNFYS